LGVLDSDIDAQSLEHLHAGYTLDTIGGKEYITFDLEGGRTLCTGVRRE
jgi:hypothetical protein